MSRVVVVKGTNSLSQGKELNMKILIRMYEQGFSVLTEQKKNEDSLSYIFPVKSKIGIKINTIGGKNISTRPEAALCLANLLTQSHIREEDIIIWDRTNRELKSAGFQLNLNRGGIRIFGTDTQSMGYNHTLVSHLNVGSLFSSIQSDHISASISLAILKDHGLAGVTGGMKNYFGAIHNPNKYHDTNCNPYVAEVFDTDLIKKKHKLTILDCLFVQYHRGPSYHAKWSEALGTLTFSFDPVAADYVGWKTIERLRAKKGLPSLKEEDREPQYLKTAEDMGLGNANQGRIDVIEVDV
ncbi:MAG: DUF362 domain-containing protein [Candidatus Aminicenantes bacterium]|nr:DUF362 domain-containing protein [Candidatus Aminicenantes bacterium]MDH5383737.1 DUF362 domain-containing protein [Candidatus Aminicenantes bacterium]MDH5742562.1 DUF362 domain-containing protein [Candidatus Aminicenantes bacterium]